MSGVFVGTLRPRMAVALLDCAAVELGGNLRTSTRDFKL